MKKKKVLFLMNNVKYGGGETVATNIIKNLSNKYEFIYACPTGIENKVKAVLEIHNVRYIEFKKLTIPTLNKLLKYIKPDIIHTHGFRSSMIASFSLTKIPIVSHLHNYYTYLNTFNLKTILFKLSCYRYKTVICCERDILNKSIFKKAIINKSYIIDNVVDSKEVIKKSKEYICNEKFDLIFIGNLIDRKNPLKFIEIIESIKRDKSNIKAAIIGDGVLFDKCNNLIKEMRLEENIKMYGYCENPFPVLKNSNILVMTSINEGLPMVALEAISLNKKLVVNENCGLNDVIGKDRDRGYICRTIEEYHKKIVEYMDLSIENVNDKTEYNNNFERYINKIDKIYSKCK